jgi:hypothetical protein
MADNLDVNPNRPNVNEFPRIARRFVYNHVKKYLSNLHEANSPHSTFAEDEVYVVWFAFVLGGWKALCSTTLPDGRYYEVTYDKNRQKVYLDVYVKHDNIEMDPIINLND